MPKGLKSFNEILEEAKEIIAEHNISFDEIEKNTGVDAEFARILFDSTTRTQENISRIFDFLKIRFVSKKYLFRPYVILGEGGQIRARRTIKPICTMYYDRNKDQFFKFRYDLKRNRPSKIFTDIIKSEMRDAVYDYMSKK